MLKKKLYSVTFWLLLFISLVVVETISTFAQDADITGSWKNASVGMIQYQNQVTGATKPGRGSIFTYKFLPDGKYEFVGYMEMTMYNCTTTLFNQISGKYSVDGSTINLDPARDYWKNTNSCAASGNKEQTKAPVKKSYELVTKTDDYGKDVLCLNDGKGETCYHREK